MVDRTFLKTLVKTTPYVVIGNPIAHSLSPQIHTQFAAQTQQDMHYGKLCVEKEDFFETLDLFFQYGGLGANITAPFKKMAYEYVGQNFTPEAQISGSVNTLKKVPKIQDPHHFIQHSIQDTHDFSILGHNTDGLGLRSDLEQKNYPITNKRILILGAGGATQGIIPALLEQSPGCLEIYNRTPETLEALLKKFPFCSSYKNQDTQLNTQLKTPTISHARLSYDLIINTLPSKAFQNMDVSNLSLIPIPAHTYAYDLNYDLHHKTPFLEKCVSLSQHQADGLGMLIAQAAESFYFWRGRYPLSNPRIK